MPRYSANTTSFIQMQVTGDTPSDRFAWLSERLASHVFNPIDETADEMSIGWTRADNIDEPTFDVPIAFMRDNYALFSLRVDQRKINSAVLKSHVAREEKKYLEKNPNLRRVPKQKREEIKGAVKLKLLAKADPVPSVIDVAWDLSSGALNLFTTSTAAIDRFEDAFRKTFEGFSLTLIHPFARAQRLVSGELLDKLTAANQASSDTVTTLIRDNRWIGNDFLLFLLYRGLNGASDYAVNTPGHTDHGAGFAAWIDEKILMQGGGEEGNIQKVAVTGSQDQYREVRTALIMHKNITSGTVYIEHAENEWKITLDGEKFFFKSCKCPNVRVEKDATVDQMSELEAVFYERMFLLEQGLQFFDSLLLAFLQIRLGTSWDDQCQVIQQWIVDGDDTK